MADDEESWEEPTKREPLERAAAMADLMRFYRDLSEVQLECGRLCVALERRDTLGMEFAASRLAAAARVASATIALVEVPQIESLQRQIAKLALHTCRQVVAHLFDLVCQACERREAGSPRFRRVLRQLCDELGMPIVDGKPRLPDECEAGAS